MACTACSRSARTARRTLSSSSGDEHLAARVEPLADAEPAPTRREEGRRLRIHLEVVHARALLPPELEHVLEALGGEHGGDRALLLEDGVGGDGGAVDEALDVGRPRAGQREHAGDRGADALEEILGRARHLGEREAARVVEGHDVGEGAADVDADLHRGPPWRRPGYHRNLPAHRGYNPRHRTFRQARGRYEQTGQGQGQEGNGSEGPLGPPVQGACREGR